MTPPPAPATVKLVVASLAVGAMVIVSVLETALPSLTLAGANAAVTPAGRPVTLKATVPVNPFAGETVTVIVDFALGLVIKVVFESPSWNDGDGTVTLTASDAVCVNPPPVAATVSV